MNTFTNQDYSWARPNRRFIGAGHYLPSTGRAPRMGPIVIQIDISGSTSKQELDYYNGHLQAIVEQCHPETVHVLYTDTQVQRHEEFQHGEEFSLTFYSGGGTNMCAGHDWCAEQGITPEVFVTLTDMYTPFGEDPGFPTIWCSSSEIIAPYGETVRFEMEN